ncbi:MAG: hypothetical protein DRI61_03495 [Chloroflexi bacterium]|nr:MAG: hypothetical protein DRI61_03495 [Chloroflexota bacterium]
MASPEALKLRRKILGLVIQRARVQARKTIRECAEAIGISPRSFSAVEKGDKDLSLPQLEILARLLGLSPRKLWDGVLPEESSEEFQPPSEKAINVRHKIIGLLLEEARAKAGKSLTESARALGVSTRTLKAYEKGDKPIPLSHLDVLAELYGVDRDYFLQQGLFPPDEREKLAEEIEGFLKLPPEIRQFVVKPANVLYLRSAMHLSKLSAEEIRKLAESLLDITF